MLSKEEIENKNLLENADFGKGESKSVTDFLETECNKCGNKIKFRLGIANIKDVEDYIDKLETKIKELSKGQQSLMQSRRKWKNRNYKIQKKNKKLESDKQKLIEKLEERKTKHRKYIEECRKSGDKIRRGFMDRTS